MNYLLVAFLLLVSAFAVSVVVHTRAAKHSNTKDLALAGIVWFGLLAFTAGLVLLIVSITHVANHSTCEGFAAATGRPVKWVEYNSFTHKCLVNTTNGWVPLEQVRGS